VGEHNTASHTAIAQPHNQRHNQRQLESNPTALVARLRFVRVIRRRALGISQKVLEAVVVVVELIVARRAFREGVRCLASRVFGIVGQTIAFVVDAVVAGMPSDRARYYALLRCVVQRVSSSVIRVVGQAVSIVVDAIAAIRESNSANFVPDGE
jgi:hypothetical protein